MKTVVVNADFDYQLINNIQREISSIERDFPDKTIIQVITSPCFTQALIIYRGR